MTLNAAHKVDTFMTVDEIMSRCRTAVRLAFRGDKYGTDAVEEAEAVLRMKVWESLPHGFMATAEARPLPTGLSGPAVVYSKLRARKTKDGNTLEAGRPAFPADLVPSYGVMMGMAKNLRKSADRAEAHLKAGGTDTLDVVKVATDEGNRDPHVTAETARETALALLDALGLRPLRKGDEGLYALAYTAARWTTLYALDVSKPGEQIAAELGIEPAAYRQRLARAAKRIPALASHARPAIADALHMTGGLSMKPSRSRTLSADLNDSGPRDSQRGHENEPVVRSYDPPVWHAPMIGTEPAWTRTLSATQHARLRMAAKLSVGKAAREEAMRAERRAARQEAQEAHDAAREDIDPDGDDSACQGHPAIDCGILNAAIGTTIYCDGSCRGRDAS